MRSFAIAAVMTGLVAGAGYLLAPAPDSGSAAAPSLDAPTPDPSGSALDAGSIAAGEVTPQSDPDHPEAAVRTYYQWTDERGGVRFAQSLDAVPAQWRERAGRIEVDTNANQAPPTRTAARTRPGSSAAIADEPRRAHEVVLYTATWCGACRMTVAFLDERGIDYVNKDIDEDPENKAEMFAKGGPGGIPLVDIDGTLLRGFRPQEMLALLE